MESREKILEKIEKLLALAGNNPSEKEAISAALKAQELMAKYNIELADLEGKSLEQNIVEETYTPKANCHYVRKWRPRLSQRISAARLILSTGTQSHFMAMRKTPKSLLRFSSSYLRPATSWLIGII